jgi:hypothetical protein
MWRRIRSLMLCRGEHHPMVHFLGNTKVWECSRCGLVYPILESLTRASGSFTPEARESARQVLRNEQDGSSKIQESDELKSRKRGA